MIYEKAYNSSFHQKIGSVQYNACLAITSAIRGKQSPRGILFLPLTEHLRWLLLNKRYFKRKALRWARSRVPSTPSLVQKAMLLLQILQIWRSQYLFKLVPLRHSPYTTRNTENIALFKTKHNFFKNSFFRSAVIEWNSVDHNIRNVRSFSAFKNNILKFIRPTPKSVFNCENHRGIKHITRLHVGLSHLHEHKFKHSFQDIVNPIWSCGFDVESTSH